MNSLTFLILIMGMAVGSFLNVCIYRIPRGMSVAVPPSHCTKCGKRLKAFDLIPVASYVILQGKCRHCGESFSPRYPIIELLTGIGFLFLYYKFGLTLEYLTMLVLFSGLIVCSVVDLDYKIIPDPVNLVMFALGILLLAVQSTGTLLNGLLGAAAGFSLLFFIALLSKGGMGGGDIKLGAVLGLYMGWPQIFLVLLLSFVLGSAAGLLWIGMKKKSVKEAVPFGPFLSAAALVSIFWGEQLINWYVNWLN